MSNDPPASGDGHPVRLPVTAGEDSSREAAAGIERYLGPLADALPQPVAYLDRDGHCRFANTAWAEWQDEPAGTLSGRTLAGMLDIQSSATVRRHIVSALKGHALAFATTLRHRERGARSVRVHLVPCRDPVHDTVLGAFALITDVTGDPVADTAEAIRTHRTAAMGELVPMLIHELGQPLGALTSYTGGAMRLLRTGATAEELMPVLQGISEQVQSARRMLQALREFTDRSDGKRAALDINQVLQRSVRLTKPKVEGNRVTIHMDIAPSLPPVLGDAIQLQQVLVNLILNAVDAMADTDRRLLTLRSTTPAPGEVELMVGDSGEGIAAQRLGRIFDAFHSTRPQGMGMGLAICRSLVDAHGGRLWAESMPGEGTRFFVRLPAAAPDASGGGRT